MAKWEKTIITNDAGKQGDAVAPVIISASRATDIPAFYADWFMERLRRGYSVWTNPFIGASSYISYEKTRLIVFWSKNPGPMLKYLPELDDMGINYYFHFTVNDYEKEGLEKAVPPLAKRIETFAALAGKIGPEKVIWRYDPFILTDNLGPDELLEKAGNIGNKLDGLTEKLVFGFADIGVYKKVERNLKAGNINFREFTDADKRHIAQGLAAMNEKWGYELGLCSDNTPVADLGITRNKCIDDDLIARCFPQDRVLMDFLGIEIVSDLFSGGTKAIKHRSNKDTGQRKICGCIVSKDIGQYHTCPHQCEYCYANTSKASATANYRRSLANQGSETITGD